MIQNRSAVDADANRAKQGRDALELFRYLLAEEDCLTQRCDSWHFSILTITEGAMTNESDPRNLFSSLINNSRFLATLAAMMLLGMLLFFARDLADVSGFRQHLIGGLAVYVLATLVLGQIETNVNNHARNQADKDTLFPPYSGSWRFVRWYEEKANAVGHLIMRSVQLLHCILLLLLIVYLAWRGCL